MARPILQTGDEVRVVAPSHSLAIIAPNVRAIADERLAALGLKVTFGTHVEECDEFMTSSVSSRLADIHEAYSDPNVKAVMAVIGGYAANQLLPHIDWDLIRRNPKPLIGYSDTTVLQAAFYAKAGIISYSGPAYSTFGQEKYFEYSLEHFKKCVMQDGPFEIGIASEWTDDLWFLDQDDRHPIPNSGWSLFGSGTVKGKLVGGNLNTLRLLQGTEYFPVLENSVLFLEDDELASYAIFDRELESLTQIEAFIGVRGIVMGRFQKKSNLTKGRLEKLVAKERLSRLPIIADVDFGHTSPLCTYPIGGEVEISIENRKITII